MGRRFPRRVWITALAGSILAASALAGVTAAAENNAYVVHNLVSDVPGAADHVDANLVNAWGLTSLATSPWWVADNGANVTTLYQANGSAVSLVVQVPSAPTGAVSNAGTHFVVSSGSASGPALFIFATEDGKILGWNSAVPPPPPSHQAEVAVDHSSVGAVYKGLAIASTSAGDRLYATDFHNNRVDVFDGSWNQVTLPGAFVDPKIPDGFAPFGIQNIGRTIFVTYAKQDDARHDDVAGQGLGFVDMFDTSGALLGRVAQRGQLNSPWGLAMAPASFGRFGGDLLVGNFGDGQINAYELQPNGKFEHRGELRGTDGKALAIDGLWSLQFGKGAVNNGPLDTLFFTAGPNGEADGLFGTIRAG
jgi:uncharacterized protein (TIGR03118 family)